jgi:hypothetical protein
MEFDLYREMMDEQGIS